MEPGSQALLRTCWGEGAVSTILSQAEASSPKEQVSPQPPGPELLFLFLSARCDPKKETSWGLGLQPEAKAPGRDLRIGAWLVFFKAQAPPKKSPGGGSELQCPYLKST